MNWLDGNLLSSMTVFLLKDGKKASLKEYRKKQMKIVIYTEILE